MAATTKQTETRYAFTHGPEMPGDDELATLISESPTYEYESEAVYSARISGYLEQGAIILRLDITTTTTATVEEG